MPEDKKQVNKLIEDSGIITHYKVIDALRKNDWNLLISPYYYDNIANTIKEIDIVAEKSFGSVDGQFDESAVQINVQLFLECKYIKQEIVFWFDDIDKDQAVSKLESETGLDILYGKPGADITPEKFHYLSNEKVAKLFSTNTNREDIIYKAMSQCLHAKIYYDQWFNKPIYKQFKNPARTKTKILKYPVIICDNFNQLKEINFEGDYKHGYKDIKDYFQLELNYTYLDRDRTSARQDYFLIDVVDFNHLEEFLGGLEKEVKSLLDPYYYKVNYYNR